MLTLNHPQYQSRYLYLQAAGSDASDGSARGVHLRWDFRGRLRDRHLPKGDLSDTLYPTTIAFNRPQDYVRIFRAEYKHRAPIVWNLTSVPTRIEETGGERCWEYDVRSSSPGGVIEVRFLDVGEYDALRAAQPELEPFTFLMTYRGALEVGVQGKLSFEVRFVEFSLQDRDRAEIKLETVTQTDNGDEASHFLSCRKRIQARQGDFKDPVHLICENMPFLRFQLQWVDLYQIEFSTYADTIEDYHQNQRWVPVGDFSLSVDDAKALERLEDPARFVIDKAWPKFNGQRPGSDAFTVSAENYRDRWQPAADPSLGIKAGLESYLELSRTDPEAVRILPDEEGISNSEVSYLEMLRIVSVDFHVARMLGLGHIDSMTPDLKEKSFLYVAEYVTEAPLEPGQSRNLRTHYFMTLPTAQVDPRPPSVPSVRPAVYGLFIDNGTQTPTRISDEEGYVPAANGPHDYVRFINLFRNPFRYEEPLRPFFETETLFCLCHESLPVLFGLEYRRSDEPADRVPEILQDTDYNDPAGLPEVAPILDSGELHRPLYTHRETEEGVHVYGLYSINWFSRVSPTSPPVLTDATLFPRRNSLRPPSNLAVQLIQREDPRIFTTEAEQNALEALNAPDKTLVRATFDWNHLHNDEYQFADTVEFFFRENAPQTVQGGITEVTELSGHRVRVGTGPFAITSVEPNRVVRPFMAAADRDKFIGSLLMVDQVPYEVEQVSAGQNPRFTLKKARSTAVTDVDGDGTYQVSESFASPPVGAFFLVYENLSSPLSWDFRLTKTLAIRNFLPTHTETVQHPDQTQRVITLGGIARPATLAEFPDRFAADDPAVLADPGSAPHAGDPIPGSHTGVFSVTFPGFRLPQHPDADIDWYKGTVRIAEDAALFPAPGASTYRPPEVKVLQVADIVSLDPLRLTVLDPTFDPASAQADPTSEYMPIQTGANVAVNFHPSYRVYMRADTAGAHHFDAATLLPAAGEGRKITFMAARSKDSTANPELHSALSNPAPLLAMEIAEPIAPLLPSGALYATRPDFYGKATYTLDAEVVTAGGRQPYSLIFYRANERQVLDVLYRPQTVDAILRDLAGLPEDDAAFFTDRWSDLVNVRFDPATDRFKRYTPDGYRFPLPDNDRYVIPNADPTLINRPFGGARDLSDEFTVTVRKDHNGQDVTVRMPLHALVKEAIENVFLPLTEKPILYKYIKSGRQTSSKPPKVRDADGHLIFPAEPVDFSVFDPYPMVVRFTEGSASKVRFTDYTLDGASTSAYFYFAVELSNRLEESPASPVLGPIQMVNAVPAEEPTLRAVTSQAAHPLSGTPVAVRLSINPYIESERIRKIRVYRARRAADAATVRTMRRVGDFDAGTELVDEFADLAFPPYGEPLFYRVVALREIHDERGALEYVPSKPSKIALTSIIDNTAPPAPSLRFTSDPPSASPVTLGNVRLQWDKTVHNGTYHLYKRNNSGHWSILTSVHSNDATLDVHLNDTAFGQADLPKENDDGEALFHHFKVTAENASGLLSTREDVLTI